MSAAPEQSRLDILQALRGVAALSVLALHDSIPYPTGTKSVDLGNGGFAWGWIGVDVFFCLSGFIMAWVHGADIGRPERALAFALKRFFRIYPPYFVFLLMTLALGAVSAWKGHAPNHELTWPTICQSIFLLPPAKNLVIVITWTLSHETLFYFLFCAAIVLGSRIALLGVVVWLAGIFFYPHPFGGVSSQACDFIFNPVNLEFLTGLAAAYLVRRAHSKPAIWAALIVSLVFLVFGLSQSWWAGVHSPGTLQEKLPLAVACAALIYGLVGLELNYRPRVPQFLVLLGTASYSIYLVHANVIRWLGYAVDARFPALFRHPEWLQPFSVTVALIGVAAGLAYYYAVERPLLSASRRWMGMKLAVAAKKTNR